MVETNITDIKFLRKACSCKRRYYNVYDIEL